MLAQEWDWNKAMEIKARDAVRQANERWESVVADKDAQWESVVADMAAEIAALKAKLGDTFLGQ